MILFLQANTWIDLADGQSHKIAIERRQNKIFLRVDDGPEHYSQLPGKCVGEAEHDCLVN